MSSHSIDLLQSAPSGSVPTSAPGSMAGGNLEDTTLDEPVVDTILRDLRMVWNKLKKVVIPSADTKDELRNW
jgi:hypothetical protein